MVEPRRKSFLKRNLKYFVIYLLFVFVAVNFYLKHSNTLIYSNATDDVAMLDIKWGMSPTEILQVTNREFEAINLLDNHYKSISQKLPIIDHANMSQVNYYFVNNQLFKVRIKKPIESYSEQRVAKFIERIGFDKNDRDLVSGLYEGEKYQIEKGKLRKSLYIGFDSSNKPTNTYVTMYYEPIAKKYEI